MPESDALAPSDKRVLQTLLWALKPLDNLTPRSIPLPYAITFLTIALDEGKPIGAYARDLDLDRFVMTRYIQCIGDKGRHGKAGLGLITVKRTETSPTRTEVYLTDKGRVVATQVLGSLYQLIERLR
jgi:hypothetical protein